VPVFEITPVESNIKFDVEASVPIDGTFDKWTASLTFTSAESSTGVLEIKILADSVDTGSGMKNSKLKGKNFFAVKENPYITFDSTKVEQTGPDTDRKDYGMNSGIPFIKIANRVEVRVSLKARRISGPPVKTLE
jgi:polyisoprenoid-binding protein YceI